MGQDTVKNAIYALRLPGFCIILAFKVDIP